MSCFRLGPSDVGSRDVFDFSPVGVLALRCGNDLDAVSRLESVTGCGGVLEVGSEVVASVGGSDMIAVDVSEADLADAPDTVPVGMLGRDTISIAS